MAKARRSKMTARRSAAASSRNITSAPMGARGGFFATSAAAALEDARLAGLLDGGKTAHVSFRAPPALVAAAKRESGATSLTQLGILALAMLAHPDPAASFLKRIRLGEAETLEY